MEQSQRFNKCNTYPGKLTYPDTLDMSRLGHPYAANPDGLLIPKACNQTLQSPERYIWPEIRGPFGT